MQLNDKDRKLNDPTQDEIEFAKQKLNQEDNILKILKKLRRRILSSDQHGHSVKLEFRVHPAMNIRINEEMGFFKSYKNKSEFLRTLLEIGLEVLHILKDIDWDEEHIAEMMDYINTELIKISLKNEYMKIKEKVNQFPELSDKKEIEERMAKLEQMLGLEN